MLGWVLQTMEATGQGSDAGWVCSRGGSFADGHGDWDQRIAGATCVGDPRPPEGRLSKELAPRWMGRQRNREMRE